MLKDKEKTDLMLKTKNIFEKKKTENKFWLKLYLFSTYTVMDLLNIISQTDREK